jgi:hypothetical protein
MHFTQGTMKKRNCDGRQEFPHGVTLDWIDGYAYREMTFHSPTTATATIAIPPPITKEIQRSLAFIGSSIDHLYTF